MACNTAQFVKKPGKDFTRNRKLGFVQLIHFFLCMESGCISHELLKYFISCPMRSPLFPPLSSSGQRSFRKHTRPIYAHRLRLSFGLRCPKPAYPPCRPYIRFLFVRLRFRYPFFSPTPHGVNLGSRFGVRRQLRPLWTFTTD